MKCPREFVTKEVNALFCIIMITSDFDTIISQLKQTDLVIMITVT